MESECPSDLCRRAASPLFGALVSLAAALAFSGCATTYDVKVDSLTKPNAEQAVSYKIVNKNPSVSEDTLRYKEAVGYVRTALSGKGLYEAPDPEKADLVLAVDYGLGPPKASSYPVSDPGLHDRPRPDTL
jgi:hypothetical protein